MNRRYFVIAALALLQPLALAGTGMHRPFRRGSFAAILSQRQGQPFVLVMWSITCIPCRKEFELLRILRADYPRLPLVFVSTDDLADAGMASNMLVHYGLEREESWMFDGDAERLRYEIDPAWYGELPRTYFYDAAHAREGVSGSLTRERIETWVRAMGLA